MGGGRPGGASKEQKLKMLKNSTIMLHGTYFLY
jgi:hypothetical protein